MIEREKADVPTPSPVWLAASVLPALTSFCFFRAMRATLTSIKAAHSALRPESSRKWQVLSGELTEKPLALPFVMTGAPRWNPHAFAGGVGPIFAREAISFDLAAARRSAGEWFFVIYGQPGRETVGSLSSLNTGPADPGVFKVPRPGRYVIGARYYHHAVESTFPAIRADGAPCADARTMLNCSNDFMAGLGRRDGFFYRALAYYIHPMLRARRWLPEKFVRREFLPVGNPETSFRYGICRRGSRLFCHADNSLLQTHHVYVCLYSRSSFPVRWGEAGEAGIAAGLPVDSDGYYLVRIHRKTLDAQPAPDLERSISIEVQAHPRLNKPVNAA